MMLLYAILALEPKLCWINTSIIMNKKTLQNTVDTMQ